MLSEAHSLLIDIYNARGKKNEVIHGDGLTTDIKEIGGAIDRLRVCQSHPIISLDGRGPKNEPNQWMEPMWLIVMILGKRFTLCSK